MFILISLRCLRDGGSREELKLSLRTTEENTNPNSVGVAKVVKERLDCYEYIHGPGYRL